MRADRLIAILLMLQQRGRVSAGAIAKELEVSRRTVMRDLESLGAAGVPIYAIRGPAGGYELWDGFRTQLTGMTADEVRAIPAWGLPHIADMFGLGDALIRTRLKVAMSLPAANQGDLERLDRMFLHDPQPLGALLPDSLVVLAKAVQRQRVLRMRHGPTGSPMTAYPLALVDNAGSWFLVADIAGERTALAVEVLGDIKTTGRRFHRPDDFDLREFWEDWRSGLDDAG